MHKCYQITKFNFKNIFIVFLFLFSILLEIVFELLTYFDFLFQKPTARWRRGKGILVAHLVYEVIYRVLPCIFKYFYEKKIYSVVLKVIPFLVCSFDDILCLADSSSLSDITLDGNPIAQESWYKHTVLHHMMQLRQLDMKRITVRTFYKIFSSDCINIDIGK